MTTIDFFLGFKTQNILGVFEDNIEKRMWLHMIILWQLFILCFNLLLFIPCKNQQLYGGSNMTDWWGNAAVIISGIITACASLGAVVYTNVKTKKQFVSQEEKYNKEKQEQEKKSKHAIIKPSYRLVTFNQVLDSLVISNDYNRVLLFSGDDGFEFYDDTNKRNEQTQRILYIENKSGNDIKNVKISSCTKLTNISTNETIDYKTNNFTFLLRNGESIIIRLKSQEQFNRIIEMNRAHIPSEILFRCVIEYETMADQTINYIYEVSIQNDTIINVISDGVVSEEDTNKNRKIPTTQSVFRNLQDSISTIDRSAYAWQKMGESQVRALYLFMQNMQCNTTGTNTNEKEQNHS